MGPWCTLFRLDTMLHHSHDLTVCLLSASNRLQVQAHSTQGIVSRGFKHPVAIVWWTLLKQRHDIFLHGMRFYVRQCLLCCFVHITIVVETIYSPYIYHLLSFKTMEPFDLNDIHKHFHNLFMNEMKVSSGMVFAGGDEKGKTMNLSSDQLEKNLRHVEKLKQQFMRLFKFDENKFKELIEKYREGDDEKKEKYRKIITKKMQEEDFKVLITYVFNETSKNIKKSRCTGMKCGSFKDNATRLFQSLYSVVSELMKMVTLGSVFVVGGTLRVTGNTLNRFVQSIYKCSTLIIVCMFC